MTKLTFEEYRQAFGDQITIWGGIPSILMLEESISDNKFYKYMDELFTNIGSGSHLILSVADTLPPATKFERIEHIARMAREFGPVKSESGK